MDPILTIGGFFLGQFPCFLSHYLQGFMVYDYTSQLNLWLMNEAQHAVGCSQKKDLQGIFTIQLTNIWGGQRGYNKKNTSFFHQTNSCGSPPIRLSGPPTTIPSPRPCRPLQNDLFSPACRLFICSVARHNIWEEPGEIFACVWKCFGPCRISKHWFVSKTVCRVMKGNCTRE